MACRRRIDRLARRPGVGEQERPVHGQPLGRGDGQRIAVIETDIAVPVADLVMAEADPAAVVGPAGNQHARLPAGLPAGFAAGLPAGLGPQDPEIVDRDHGAVEQLLVPVGGADPEPVAAGDLQRRGCPLVLRSPAHGDGYPVRIGRHALRHCREPARAHQVRQRPDLGPGPRQHHAGPVGMQPPVPVPVVDQAGQGVVLVMADMEPPPWHDGPRWRRPHRRRAAPSTPPPATG